MLFRIKKCYKSELSAQEIFRYIEHLKQKESGFWKLRNKVYDVQSSGGDFVLKKRGGNTNGPAYPLIKGQIQEGECVLVNLDIKPSYGGLVFCAIISLVLLLAIISHDEMTINGIPRKLDLSDRLFWAMFSIGAPAILCYLKDIRPVMAAENWLIKKLSLKEI